MDIPLQLNEYFFPHVEVMADPTAGERESDKTSNNFTVKVGSTKVDQNNDVYQVTLEILSKPEIEGSKQNYTIKLIAIGFFSVDSEKEDVEKLLRVSGASILYASAREFLITITARGPWGPVMLPIASFLEIYEENNKNKTAVKRKPRKTKQKVKQEEDLTP